MREKAQKLAFTYESFTHITSLYSVAGAGGGEGIGPPLLGLGIIPHFL